MGKATATKKGTKRSTSQIRMGGDTTPQNSIKIKTILISQPEPTSVKSPYYALAEKYKVQLEFFPFIGIEGVSAKEFRKQKIEIQNHTAIIFTSRNAIDHFFRICEELKVKVSTDMKYFCISEAIALYLQKFIVYRKRKIFFGEGNLDSLLQVILKHKSKEKFIVPINDLIHQKITSTLIENGIEYKEAQLYYKVCNECQSILDKKHDVIVFFSPGGVQSLFENKPNFKQNGTRVATFGPTTRQAALDAGLELHIEAPTPNAPSMVAALENYLKTINI